MYVRPNGFIEFYETLYFLYLKIEWNDNIEETGFLDFLPQVWDKTRKNEKIPPCVTLFSGGKTKRPRYFHDLYLKFKNKGLTSYNIDDRAYFKALAYINRYEEFYEPVDLKLESRKTDILNLHLVPLHNAFLASHNVSDLDPWVSIENLDNKPFLAKLQKTTDALIRRKEHTQYRKLRDEIIKFFDNYDIKLVRGEDQEIDLLKLEQVFDKNIDPNIRELFPGKTAWSFGNTLIAPRNVREGWRIKDVTIEIDDYSFFQLPSHLKKKYSEYKETVFRELGFEESKDRLMLSIMPHKTTNQPKLSLVVKRIKWSEIAFFHHLMKSDTPLLRSYLENVADKQPNEIIDYPNSLVLHPIVESTDGYFLLTKIKNRAEYTKSWALTLGKQLDFKKHFKDGAHSEILQNWVKDALDELNLKSRFDADNLRFMALNFETNVANFSLAAIVKVDATAKMIDTVLKNRFGNNDEHSKWLFMDKQQLLDELFLPGEGRDHHPSTGLRILYALIYKLSPDILNAELIKRGI